MKVFTIVLFKPVTVVVGLFTFAIVPFPGPTVQTPVPPCAVALFPVKSTKSAQTSAGAFAVAFTIVEVIIASS